MSRRTLILLFTVFVSTIMTGALLVRAQSQPATAVSLTEHTFTYQGQLQSEAADATGFFDFEFSLYDASTEGDQIGQTAVINEVELVEGQIQFV